jgi:hypothetical protein
MHGGEFLIPIFLFLSSAAMIFGLRYLKNKENMSMIEKGLNPQQFVSQPKPYQYLKFALLLVGVGVGLLFAYLLDLFVLPMGRYGHDGNPAIYFSMLGIFGGLGLVVSFLIEKKQWLDKQKDQ